MGGMMAIRENGLAKPVLGIYMMIDFMSLIQRDFEKVIRDI
jgi:hypothetical protein